MTMKPLFIFLLLVKLLDAIHSRPPFRDGIEYKYEWEAKIETESFMSSEKSSLANLRGHLIVIAKQEGSFKAKIKLKNITMSLNHGDKFEKSSDFIEVPSVSQQLMKPFYILYSGSKIIAASFPGDNELWSLNFKRSISALLQFEFQEDNVYSSNELSLFGNCTLQYFTSRMFENQYVIQKDTDFNSCSKNNGKWRTFMPITSCPGNDKQLILGTTESVKYSINLNRGHTEILQLESVGTIVLDPFGIHKSSMKSSTNFSMYLEKTKRTAESINFELAFEDDLAFGFIKETPLHTISDLKTAQNLMFHQGYFDQESLRRKSLLDLIAAAETYLGDFSSVDRISVDKQLSTLSFQLGSLDYENARALYKELAVVPNNEKLHSAKNLFLDLLLHSGSNPGVILLCDLIKEQELDAFTAARLVAYAGVFIKVPSEKLLLEVQSIVEAQLPGKSDQLGIYKNAAVLSFSNLIGKTCYSNVCKIIRVEDFRNKYLDIVKNESYHYGHRALYFHALKNMGLGSTIDSLLEFSTKYSQLDDEPTNALKIYIINSFTSYKDQQKVFNALTRILKDKHFGFRARVAAAQALLNNLADDKVLDLMGNVLKSEKNSQVKHYIISAIITISESGNPCTKPFRAKAKHVLSSTVGENIPQASSKSAEYAYDFFQEGVAFGSQLNIRTTIAEFDDFFGFVAGKFLYFIKGACVEPFSFTIRATGLKRYLANYFGSSLRKEDLRSYGIPSLMENFNFAPRRELGAGADVAFSLHGATVMFYHFDKLFLQHAIGSARNLEILSDLNMNFQRYATTGALLYTRPNGLGFPVSAVMSIPLLISLRGSISKLKTAGVVGRRINLSFYGEISGDHGLLTHLTAINITQGVIRNRKAFFNVPLQLEISGDLPKMHFDFTFTNPKRTNPIEIVSFARTILTIRPSESSYLIYKRACSSCKSVIVLQKKDITSFETETFANLTTIYGGTEAYAQVFNCETRRSVTNQLNLIASALNPLSLNYRGLTSAWAFMGFIRLQHLTFIQPDGRLCGYRGRIHRSENLPVKEIVFRLRIKSALNDEPEISWHSGKFAFKLECVWKGENAISDRKAEIDFSYDYRNSGARNSLNVRAIAFRNPTVGITKDTITCFKVEENYTTSPSDMIDISGYKEVPNAYAIIEYVMGEIKSQQNQCPTDQFRFKVNVKASAGDWVIKNRDEAMKYPYSECEKEKKHWAPGLTPQTDACYRSALEFSTLHNYQLDFKFASVPSQVERLMGKISDLIGISLQPYLNIEEGTYLGPKDVTQAQVNITFLPDFSEEHTSINLDWAVNNVIRRYSQINLPWMIRLPSTTIPQSSRLAYDGDLIPSCLVTPRYIKTLDKVKFNNTFSPCYSLVSSDCGTNPLFGVFVRKINGVYPLAVKVQVGGHSIEIIPDETGRRKEFAVKADELDVDILRNPVNVPEGREKFYVLRVRYQSPVYIISAPGAGFLVHFSGSHIAVFPSWLYKNQHCGLCGNFDGEMDHEWLSPQGCVVKDSQQLIASYTVGETCYLDREKNVCPETELSPTI